MQVKIFFIKYDNSSPVIFSRLIESCLLSIPHTQLLYMLVREGEMVQKSVKSFSLECTSFIFESLIYINVAQYTVIAMQVIACMEITSIQ